MSANKGVTIITKLLSGRGGGGGKKKENHFTQALKTIKHFIHLQLISYKIRQENQSRINSLDLWLSTEKRLHRRKRESDFHRVGDNSTSEVPAKRPPAKTPHLVAFRPRSGPGRSPSLSCPVSPPYSNISVTPFSTKVGATFKDVSSSVTVFSLPFLGLSLTPPDASNLVTVLLWLFRFFAAMIQLKT